MAVMISERRVKAMRELVEAARAWKARRERQHAAWSRMFSGVPGLRDAVDSDVDRALLRATAAYDALPDEPPAATRTEER